MNIPPLSWYKSTNVFYVKRDLENHPEVKDKLGIFENKFIKWVANQRLIYQPDIFDEYNEFENIFIKTRLYYIDIDQWNIIRQQVFKRDNFTCQYCGQVGGILEPDHIIPISKNGTNHINNLITSCRKCNRQKRDKLPEDFIQWKMKVSFYAK